MIQALDLTELETAIGSSVEPLLVDFWADWCAPCLAMSPVIDKLALSRAGHLRCVKVDVQAFAEAHQRFGFRSIPTLVLFRGGHEIARWVGSATLPRLSKWLASFDIGTDALPDTGGRDEVTDLGAFYGDAGLRHFLVERTIESARQGRLVVSRFPRWSDRSASISASLALSSHPDVFERKTGLPYAIGIVMELASVATAPAAEEIFGSLRPGMLLESVPLQVVARWLSDPELPWTEMIADNATDDLRVRWVSLACCAGNGISAPDGEWEALRTEALRVLSPANPMREVHNALRSIVALLSPPPAIGNDAPWGEALLLYGKYLQFALAQHAIGWTHEDRAYEGRQHAWLTAKEKQQPGEKWTEVALQEAHARWESNNQSAAAKNAAFVAQIETLLEPVWARVRQHFCAACAESSTSA